MPAMCEPFIFYLIRYLPFHCPAGFSQFVSQAMLIYAGVVAIVPVCSQGQEPCVCYDSSVFNKYGAEHTKQRLKCSLRVGQ